MQGTLGIIDFLCAREEEMGGEHLVLFLPEIILARDHFLLNLSKYISTLKIYANISHNHKEINVFRIIIVLLKESFHVMSRKWYAIDIIFICGKMVSKVLLTNINVKTYLDHSQYICSFGIIL